MQDAPSIEVLSARADAGHERLVRRETVLNTVLTAVIAAALTWVLFHGRAGIAPLAPVPDGIFGILPGTFNFTLLVTLGLSASIRHRVARGRVTRIAVVPGRAARLPRLLLLRALLLAAAATVLLVPLTYGVVWTCLRAGFIPALWSFTGMTVFFVAYFCALSLIITPWVVWRALQD